MCSVRFLAPVDTYTVFSDPKKPGQKPGQKSGQHFASKFKSRGVGEGRHCYQELPVSTGESFSSSFSFTTLSCITSWSDYAKQKYLLKQFGLTRKCWPLNFGFPAVRSRCCWYRKFREVCRKDFHQVAPLKTSMVPNCDQQTKTVNEG